MKVAILRVYAIVSLLVASGMAPAMAPPRPGEIERLRASGSLVERAQQARQIGNHRLDPTTIATLSWQAGRSSGRIQPSAPPPARTGGLPPSGSPRVLVLLIDFADFPSDAASDPAFIAGRMFGTGDARSARYPYETLRAFYQRSSYGVLDIQGTVTAWYRAQYPRGTYQRMGMPFGNTALIDEALTHLQNQGHDLAQYDSDGDGFIDTFFVKYTGPDTGWSSFWWAYQWQYFGNKAFNGVRPRKFIWSWVANPAYDGEPAYEPRIDIHELGHALGLPDYYDYDDAVGPRGGLGRLDMMDGNWGDHNAFSKIVLGWQVPTVVSEGTVSRALGASGIAGDAVLIMPGASAGSLFGEYFVAQYRRRGVGNDPLDYPADGITLWHVDASLNAGGTDYLYNNSDAAHKLIRLVQADGLGEIEAAAANADAADFYIAGRSFGPTTNPNSARYDGTSSDVRIAGIGVAGGAEQNASFSVGVVGPFPLTVVKGGEGTGVVRSSPSGISCGTACATSYPAGTTVTLSATAGRGYAFSGWSGACSGTAATCLVSMTGPQSVLATFTTARYPLTVTKDGAGAGRVSSSPLGIDCGVDCNESLPAGTLVILTAAAGAGSFFTGWSGACSGTGADCRLSMTTARSVVAKFSIPAELAVAKVGSGTGRVRSIPAGINCGTTCIGTFTAGSTVILTASPARGSVFAGWSGACAGSSPTCRVGLIGSRAVSATFNATGSRSTTRAP